MVILFLARSKKAEIGEFITRDQKWGKISSPTTLNRYTYCGNNPLKYIDPDGHDYFRPDWGQGRDRTWNIGWGALRYLLWEFETLCKLLTAYHNFGMEHGYALDALEAGGLTAVSLFFGKILAGSSWSGPLAALFTFIVALGMIILDMVAEDVAFYWNDQKFVDLWDTAVD